MHVSARQFRRGFTLLEIMVVVAIIAMLSAIAVSNIIRARKRAQAAKILDDLRTIDGALDQYALDNNKSTGDPAMFSDLTRYMKTMNKLLTTRGFLGAGLAAAGSALLLSLIHI